MKLLFIGCAVMVAWATGGVLWWAGHPGHAAPGVSAAGIRRVRLGMSPAQVLAVLGRPYHFASTKGSNTHRIATCADVGATQVTVAVTATTGVAGLFSRVAADTTVHLCDQQGARRHDRTSILTYTQPGGVARTYPMLWIHFDKQARVSNVFAKEYAAAEHCIYSLAADPSFIMCKQAALRRLFDSRRF